MITETVEWKTMDELCVNGSPSLIRTRGSAITPLIHMQRCRVT